MFNLLISLAIGALVTVLIKLFGYSIWAGAVPGVLALLGSFIFLARRIATKVQALSKAAEKELSAQPSNTRERQQRIEKAVKILEGGLAYDRWQFLIGSEIHAQIGMIRYVAQEYPAAAVHLSKASPRNYMAKALQAALHFKQKDYAKMESA